MGKRRSTGNVRLASPQGASELNAPERPTAQALRDVGRALERLAGRSADEESYDESTLPVSVKIAERVPARSIFALPPTGMGMYSENEVIVLGGTHHVYAIAHHTPTGAPFYQQIDMASALGQAHQHRAKG